MPAPVRTRLRVGVLPFLATRANEDDGLALSLSQEIAAALDISDRTVRRDWIRAKGYLYRALAPAGAGA